VIDGHLSDPELLLVKRLMDDDSIPKSKDKALRFSQQTGKSRATYFRIQKEIRERGWKKPKRIVLERTEPPSLERPDDGPLSDEDE